jgi:hypothetical protein
LLAYTNTLSMSEPVYGRERKLMAVPCLALVRTSRPIHHPSHTNSPPPLYRHPLPLRHRLPFAAAHRDSATITGRASPPAPLCPEQLNSLPFAACQCQANIRELSGDRGKRHQLPIFCAALAGNSVPTCVLMAPLGFLMCGL